ncbi:MAG: hypothetical protein Kow00121_25560 [Elainellaceae cyanobacterium]
MPVPKPLPASIRTLKARLKVLGRPAVWGSASILILALFFLSKYWQHPQQFLGLEGDRESLPTSEASESTPPSPLDPFSSVEDAETTPQSESALAPFLADFEQNRLETLRLSRPLTSSERSNPASSLPIPLIGVDPEGNSRTDLPNLGTSASFPTLSEDDLRNATAAPSTTNSQAQPAVNPLQSALDRRATDSPSTSQVSSPTPAGSASLSQAESTRTTATSASFRSGATYSPQPLPGQPLPQQTLIQPQFVPQTSPAPGTTGYRLPASLSSPVTDSAVGSFDRLSSPSNIAPLPALPPRSISPLVPPSLPSGNAVNNGINPQPQVSQPLAVPAPFSVPRAVPGRTIGGGQINTFSNP